MNLESLRNTLSTLATSLEQRFSQPRKVYLQTLTENRSLSAAGKRVLWVVGRGLLKHEIFTVAAELPPAKRRSVLELQVRRWSPFRTSRWSVVWSENRASVFVWDAEKVNAAIAAEALDPARCKIVPEPFVRAPGHDGLRLLAASDGYEAQVWENGFLAASRWWRTMPTLAEWAMMARLARISTLQQQIVAPDVVEAPILPEPWAFRRDPLEDALSLLEVPKYRAAAAVAIGALPLLLSVQWIATASANAALSSERVRLLHDSEGPRHDRQVALANLDAADDLLALEPYPSQFAVMARAADLLQASTVKVVEWSYDNGSLSFSLQGAIDATYVVEAFEKDDMFESVIPKTLSPDKLLRVQMNVTRLPGRH